MSIRAGILGVSKDVTRVMVGVNGIATPVKKIYAGDESGKAVLCYENKNSGVISSVISMGNKQPKLVAVYCGDDGNYYATGFFKDSTTLSKVKISLFGDVEDTGTSLTFGAGAMTYTTPVYGTSTKGMPNPSTSMFSFSGGLNGSVWISRANISSMEKRTFSDDTTELISIRATQYLGSNGISVYGGAQPTEEDGFRASSKARLLFHGIRPYDPVSNESFETGFVFKWQGGDVVAWNTLDLGLRITSAATLSCDLASNPATSSNITGIQETLVIKTSGGQKTSELLFVKLNDDSTVESSYVQVNGSASGKDYYVGRAISGYVFHNEVPVCPYVNTVCYTHGNVRTMSLLVDYTMNRIDEIPHDFNLAEHQEYISLEDGEDGSKYKWQVMGVSKEGKIFVLSEVRNVIKILVFSHNPDNGIQKLSEVDTGYRTSDSVTLNEVVPVDYGYSYKTKDYFVPAFMLIRDNKYGELVTVPRSVIGQ